VSDSIVLSSGRVIEANYGFIGISDVTQCDERENEYVVLGSGYDDEILVFTSKIDAEAYYVDAEDAEKNLWTPAERKELAELMIARWQEFGGMKGY
jgi:hypothetical protein